MKFEQLCETLEKISLQPSKEKKLKILNRLMNACRDSNTPLVMRYIQFLVFGF